MINKLTVSFVTLTMCSEAAATTVNHVPTLMRPALDRDPSVEWTEFDPEDVSPTPIPMYLGACSEPHMMRMSGSSFYSWKNSPYPRKVRVTNIFGLYCDPQ